jgi:Transposase
VSTLSDGSAETNDPEVVLGVDTHKHFHVAVVLTSAGVMLAYREFPTTRTGYREMITWARSHGSLHRAGVEGTASYGAALTRLLLAEGVGSSSTAASWTYRPPPARSRPPPTTHCGSWPTASDLSLPRSAS